MIIEEITVRAEITSVAVADNTSNPKNSALNCIFSSKK